ncbi:MAG: TetR/AcrR family transcriptional regulator [Mycobacterium sp.]|nr:TetR/AcrR family transcriptional regulator [Mycobacterium sp.]
MPAPTTSTSTCPVSECCGRVLLNESTDIGSPGRGCNCNVNTVIFFATAVKVSPATAARERFREEPAVTVTPAVTPVPRRAPVQARSRRTVDRILHAAAAIADEDGVDAVTTRAIADRAGVSSPSLYRFFADRDAILDELLERHCAELDARCVEAEQTWQIGSIGELLNLQLDLHVHYYRRYPSAARLWMAGRTSPTVTRHVHARMQRLAGRMHAMLVRAKLIPADTDPRALLVAVEMADRVLELSFRDNSDFDQAILDIGRRALIAFGRDLSEGRYRPVPS